jgi:hypothetical protein
MFAILENTPKPKKVKISHIVAKLGNQTTHIPSESSVKLLIEDISDSGECWFYRGKILSQWTAGTKRVLSIKYEGKSIYKNPKYNDRSPL